MFNRSLLLIYIYIYILIFHPEDEQSGLHMSLQVGSPSLDVHSLLHKPCLMRAQGRFAAARCFAPSKTSRRGAARPVCIVGGKRSQLGSRAGTDHHRLLFVPSQVGEGSINSQFRAQIQQNIPVIACVSFPGIVGTPLAHNLLSGPPQLAAAFPRPPSTGLRNTQLQKAHCLGRAWAALVSNHSTGL